jgi:hypothetical protein
MGDEREEQPDVLSIEISEGEKTGNVDKGSSDWFDRGDPEGVEFGLGSVGSFFSRGSSQ